MAAAIAPPPETKISTYRCLRKNIARPFQVNIEKTAYYRNLSTQVARVKTSEVRHRLLLGGSICAKRLDRAALMADGKFVGIHPKIGNIAVLNVSYLDGYGFVAYLSQEVS